MDAETNLTYAVRYLAGAYQAAGGNAGRAVSLYASGYHGRGVRQPAQAVAWSAPTELRAMPVALRESGVTTMRDDALRFVRY
jgi:soluble lytic murein transglycosylase-like protein